MNNKRRFYALLFILVLGGFTFTSTHADVFSRDVVVTSIFPIAEARPPVAPGAQNIIRIYVANAPWGSSTCRGDAADLLHSEKNLLSVLLTGWALGKTINIQVDDTLHPYDTVCQVAAIWVR